MTFINRIITQLFSPPRAVDVPILLFFTIFIVFNPFFMHGEINFFETGLYLPAIDTLLKGGALYKDVFYLRGPLEVLMPAAMMKFFGVHLTTLYTYFYLGNILCLMMCVLIAQEILKTRFFLYLFVPVLIGRTFPRVVFTYWGGMRFALGLAAIYCALKFIKTNHGKWMFVSGVLAALSFLTSVEIGVFVVAGVVVGLSFGLLQREMNAIDWKKYTIIFFGGMMVVLVAAAVYLQYVGVLKNFFQAMGVVLFKMTTVFNPAHASEHPQNVREFFLSLINPAAKNFRHLTPAYLYVFLTGFLVYKLFRRNVEIKNIQLAMLAGYGFVMYVAAFRAIWGAQFEMALQPEKIILFALLEYVMILLLTKVGVVAVSNGKKDIQHGSVGLRFLTYFCLIALIGSSLGYSIARLSKRFWIVSAFRQVVSGKGWDSLLPSNNPDWTRVEVGRAQGLWVPEKQAQELQLVGEFLEKKTSPLETVLMYPEYGAYYFFFDRPFPGRFPMASFSWFNETWHKELMEEFETKLPRFAIVENELIEERKRIYFSFAPNVSKYADVKGFIAKHYEALKVTPYSTIYQRVR